ncbi:hypothetical protein K378_02709 [Streptomyces sp. Amel2xB2]|nr:hypothetical protein K378_02709 [Streptomyces sp. Amel2xB2]
MNVRMCARGSGFLPRYGGVRAGFSSWGGVWPSGCLLRLPEDDISYGCRQPTPHRSACARAHRRGSPRYRGGAGMLNPATKRTTPTALTRPHLVPYITQWSRERAPKSEMVIRRGRLAFADEHPYDRDSNGVLWSRAPSQPGKGKPEFGKVHALRQGNAAGSAARLGLRTCLRPAPARPTLRRSTATRATTRLTLRRAAKIRGSLRALAGRREAGPSRGKLASPLISRPHGSSSRKPLHRPRVSLGPDRTAHNETPIRCCMVTCCSARLCLIRSYVFLTG